MSKLFHALMPASASLLDVAAEQLAADRAEIQPLHGELQLIAIARATNREMALTLKHYLDLLEEGDFASAMEVADKLNHLTRRQYLASLSDASGVVTR